ncbi:MAG TPA: ATP-binding cassette domain-containing protein [Mycobacteriales bacterium]|nr:ATP-binding cassette domain-containing protein [Mycobacteriales bacterium]
MTHVGTDALTVDDVDFCYGPLQVLFGVSLQVHQGEALALLGTNGAGKSTLLKVMCGLLHPSRGRTTFYGRDTTGERIERLTAEGVVLIAGGHSTFPDMSVRENLEMQAFTARKDRRRVAARRDLALDRFPALAGRLGQPAGTLSGGEQQQLALAKALLLDPKVLCIDELSLGLAPIVVQGLLEMVKQIHADGVTVVLVEQSLNIAAEMCERAVFMEKGQVRFEGPTAQLRDNDDIARAVFLGAS